MFKTLTKKQVLIANYPFATIDPNVGVVLVPDERVDKLAELSHSAKKIYATVDFVDIAGLVKGAAQGEGLGNKFLSHIREVDAVLYVLRAFKKTDIINTLPADEAGQNVNPLKEKEILDVELILKDLETINKRIGGLDGEVRQNKKEAVKEMAVLKKAKDLLEQGHVLIDPPRVDERLRVEAGQNFTEEESTILKSLSLLTFKPRLYLLNGSEAEVSQDVLSSLRQCSGHDNCVIVDVQNEYEAEGMTTEERRELGLPELSETDILVKKAYELLGLITFLTTGEDETRAWTIKNGDTAPVAGAAIHSDFRDKFVKAEVVFWKDLLTAGSYAKAREQGKLRTEGKEYVVADGDVIEFRHG